MAFHGKRCINTLTYSRKSNLTHDFFGPYVPWTFSSIRHPCPCRHELALLDK